MKKITSGILAVMMLLVSLVNIVAVSPVYAKTDGLDSYGKIKASLNNKYIFNFYCFI